MFPCQEGMPLLRLEGTGTQSFDGLENKCFKIFQAPPGVKYSDLRQFLDLKGDRWDLRFSTTFFSWCNVPGRQRFSGQLLETEKT